MLGAIRKFLAQLIYSNRFSRALLRRVALDEHILSDLLSTERIREKIRSNVELRRRLSSLAREMGVAPPRHNLMINTSAPSPPITDISPALNWGPHAFPLTRHAMFWRKDQKLLCERWMRRLSSDATVVLLYCQPEAEDAKSFAERHRQIKAHVALPESDDVAQWAQLCSMHPYLDALAIPIAPNDLANMYPLLHKLWCAGFRQFVLLSEQGACQIEIPQMADAFKDTHQGKRCFVLGDSFDPMALDLGKLKNGICLAGGDILEHLLNRGVAPNFWACSDSEQLKDYGLKYLDKLPAQTVKLLPLASLPYFQTSHVCPLPSDGDWASYGQNTNAALIHWAMHLGCNPICVAGINEDGDKSWQESLRRYAESRQIRIIDVSGGLTPSIFEKVDLETLL